MTGLCYRVVCLMVQDQDIRDYLRQVGSLSFGVSYKRKVIWKKVPFRPDFWTQLSFFGFLLLVSVVIQNMTSPNGVPMHTQYIEMKEVQNKTTAKMQTTERGGGQSLTSSGLCFLIPDSKILIRKQLNGPISPRGLGGC